MGKVMVLLWFLGVIFGGSCVSAGLLWLTVVRAKEKVPAKYGYYAIWLGSIILTIFFALKDKIGGG